MVRFRFTDLFQKAETSELFKWLQQHNVMVDQLSAPFPDVLLRDLGVKSRTGFVYKMAGAVLSWPAKLST